MPPPMSALIEQAMHATRPQWGEQHLSKRGRPARLSETHLGWALIWCLLMGSPIPLEIWRTIQLGFACLAPLKLTNQAISQRLSQRGMQAEQQLLIEGSGRLSQHLVRMQNDHLAPFASDVLALDESTLDQVGRGICGSQQWRRVDLLPEAVVDSKVHANLMRLYLRAGTLLLFDLGYFSFEWLDDLTRLGHFWISRMRKRTSYEIIHLLAQEDSYMEALVWLGAYRAHRAAEAVRLIRLRHQGQCYAYLTTVLDPTRLAGAAVGRLYARRWDIELAFRALKDHLHLRLLWSAKWEVIACQILACVLLANVFHATQSQIAEQAGVEVFELSMDLLGRSVPRLLQPGLEPLSALILHGRTPGRDSPQYSPTF